MNKTPYPQLKPSCCAQITKTKVPEGESGFIM